MYCDSYSFLSTGTWTKVTMGFSNLLSNYQRRPKPFRRSPHVVGQQNPASARYACDEMQGWGLFGQNKGGATWDTVDVFESNTRSFANPLSQKMDGSFSDQERQVNKMLTFLFLLKMRIMDLVPQNAFFVWNLLGLLPAPNIEFEDDFDKVKQAPLPGPLGSGVATGVPCPGGKAARPDTCFMTHRYVPRQWETSDESHIHHSLLSLILESLITLSTLYKFNTLSILWLTFCSLLGFVLVMICMRFPFCR